MAKTTIAVGLENDVAERVKQIAHSRGEDVERTIERLILKGIDVDVGPARRGIIAVRGDSISCGASVTLYTPKLTKGLRIERVRFPKSIVQCLAVEDILVDGKSMLDYAQVEDISADGEGEKHPALLSAQALERSDALSFLREASGHLFEAPAGSVIGISLMNISNANLGSSVVQCCFEGVLLP